MFSLYLITDPDCGPALIERTRQALAAAPPGSTAVQLRLKPWSSDERTHAARALRDVTSQAGAPLIVNSDPVLARAVGADGVHLPEDGPSVAEARQHLGPRTLVGASCHGRDGLESAARAGADFATLSPFYPVPGKGPVLERERARAWIAASPLPVFALGGIDCARATDAVADGAAGVAVIRSVYRADDPQAATAQLLRALDCGRS